MSYFDDHESEHVGFSAPRVTAFGAQFPGMRLEEVIGRSLTALNSATWNTADGRALTVPEMSAGHRVNLRKLLIRRIASSVAQHGIIVDASLVLSYTTIGRQLDEYITRDTKSSIAYDADPNWNGAP